MTTAIKQQNITNQEISLQIQISAFSTPAQVQGNFVHAKSMYVERKLTWKNSHVFLPN